MSVSFIYINTILIMHISKTTLQQLWYDMIDIISFLLFFAGIMLFIRLFIIQPYSVVGKSMFPTFEESDFIIVDKISPKLYNYSRGDVIVFIPPEKDIPYIKRVIGIPWDVIKFYSGNVTRCITNNWQQECKELNEPYLSSNIKTQVSAEWKKEFLVTSWWLFVMGDNRPDSSDSRSCFGVRCIGTTEYLVPYNHIIGKVFMRIYPKFQLSAF